MPRLCGPLLSLIAILSAPAQLSVTHHTSSRGCMLDLAFLLTALISFALFQLFLRFCERV